MILGFKHKFVPLILSGMKRHTIREDKTNRWTKGKKIHFATGVRTKQYRQFDEKECISTQTIKIYHFSDSVAIEIDNCFFGHVLHHGIDNIYEYHHCILKLAINDGFDTIEEFLKFFPKDFKGKIIHWTNLKYIGII